MSGVGKNWAWNGQRLAKLNQMMKNGVSTREMTRQLGGPSLGAVMRKIKELKGKSRYPSVRVRMKPKRPVKMLPVVTPVPMPEPPLPAVTLDDVRESFQKPGSIALLDAREGECRWPIDSDRAHEPRCCGDRTAPGQSYCHPHYEATTRTTRAWERHVVTAPVKT